MLFYHVLQRLPFTSERKCMSTLVAWEEATPSLTSADPPSESPCSSSSNSGGSSSRSNGNGNGNGIDHDSSRNGHGAASPHSPHSPHSIRLLTKGAAEVVLAKCDRQLDPVSGAVMPLDEAVRAALASGSGEREGLRMMALAYRDLSQVWKMCNVWKV